MWWKHILTVLVGASLYGGEKYATMMWPEVPTNAWLGISLGCGLAAVLILYRKQVVALTGVTAPAALIRPEIVGVVLKSAVLLCLVGGLAYGFFAIMSRKPDPILVHPTLSVPEQIQARAECTTRAIEATAGVATWQRSGEQFRYERACLTANGFRPVPVGERD